MKIIERSERALDWGMLHDIVLTGDLKSYESLRSGRPLDALGNFIAYVEDSYT